VTDLDPSATPGVGRPEEITGREADDATDLVDATEAADATDPAVWRGVAAEDAEAMSGAVADLLRSRSRRLAADLFGPHRRALIVLGVVIVVNQVAVLCVPWLVDYGIDHGIPSLEHHGAHRRQGSRPSPSGPSSCAADASGPRCSTSCGFGSSPTSVASAWDSTSATPLVVSSPA
jgi:hypothetical protein